MSSLSFVVLFVVVTRSVSFDPSQIVSVLYAYRVELKAAFSMFDLDSRCACVAYVLCVCVCSC